MTDKFIGSRMNCTLLVICITCIANSSQMYSITNAELSSFPDDISSSEQLVMLSNTTLSKVDADDLQTLDVLARLFIIHSQLTEVPDLRYICDTLAQLSFQGCFITEVNHGHFDGCIHLFGINLSSNRLTSFPNFGDARPSVSLLLLADNPITSIHPGDLLHYQNLETIDLANTKLPFVTNFCSLDSWIALEPIDWSLEFASCDCRMNHMFAPEILEKHPNIGDSICAEPGNLSGLNMSTALDIRGYFSCLGDSEKKRSNTFTEVRADYYCQFPNVIQRVEGITVLACAKLCVETEQCYYFNVFKNATVIFCDITSMGAAVATQTVTDPNGWAYYSIL